MLLLLLLLLACVERAPDPLTEGASLVEGQAVPAPAVVPPVVVDTAPGCDTPQSCAAVCEGGGAVACNRLGLWLQDGTNGAAKDPVTAAARYERACDLGAGIGCYNLASQKSGGQGIAADPAGAAALMARTHAAYRASCDAGALVWCTNLAGLQQRGEGVPQDLAAARALYTSSCERGDAMACVELARMLQRGEAGPGDPAAAEALLRKTCETGSAEACNNLAADIEARGGDPRSLFADACDRGIAIACRNLALRTSDSAAALPLLVRACDDPEELDGLSCAMAGDLLLATSGTPASALPFFERACSVGVAPACLEVVRLASIGVAPMTPAQALPLVERGCSLGDDDACAVLDRVRSASGTP